MAGDNQTFQFESLLEDDELLDEIRELSARGSLGGAGGVGPETIESRIRAGAVPESRDPASFAAEAIVLTHGRPSLLVRNGTFDLPDSPTLRARLEANRSEIEEAIARVGRVEVEEHPLLEWVGTGWIVAPQIVATNRHVALEFAERTNGGFAIKKNEFTDRLILPSVDFREEYSVAASFTVPVAEILYIAPDEGPDIALLKFDGDVPLPDPIPLSELPLGRRQEIGVIGYPAYDSRNGEDAMRRYFGDIYNVKRFAPGRVKDPIDGSHWFMHDCTTLGGNSGSKVIDIETGEVVGLHFAGEFKTGNYAVKTESIKEALRQAEGPIHAVPAPQAEEGVESDGVNPPEFYAGREGYDEGFLDVKLSLPDPNGWTDELASVKGAPGDRTWEARYTHFSVALNGKRRTPQFTAVNIAGQELRRLRRENTGWFIDGRIDEDLQLGNEAYRGNDLDRGHMVRRLDPVWGSREVAQLANDDTFHYANAAPQHKDLNRRDWVGLEDEVLDHARARDQRLSVFTGPVFRRNDRWYRRGGEKLVKLPKEFWKIVALVDEDTGALSTAGFILSQGDMLQDLTEVPFVADRSAVFQVEVSRIAKATGLGMGQLVQADSFSEGVQEGRARARRIRSGADMVLPRRREDAA